MSKLRVRFAPSPTGPLHIGGLRTALFNYLLAKKHGGSFILRIEDTDQKRYVAKAEEYIKESLAWAGLALNEGPAEGGDFGPYRQSERAHFYHEYTSTLIKEGWAYKAYDTAEELEAKRQEAKTTGNKGWQYDAYTRMDMRNDLTLSDAEKKDLPFVVRFKMPANEEIVFNDLIRGEVKFNSSLLDDKVLYKADGLPTYHMANVIDDHLMKISHVIRGEEWLSSTPLHVMLNKAFGWEEEMPTFAHLPLILKPNGKGKLSKRDGAKFGFPVYPLEWKDENGEVSHGYREAGFIPEALNNFLAMLGWNPGIEQEVFSMDELIESFSLKRVGKAGARFDYEKAKWFNQQHLLSSNDSDLVEELKALMKTRGHEIDDFTAAHVVQLYKPRVTFSKEIPEAANYIFSDVAEYDEKMIRKKWKADQAGTFTDLKNLLNEVSDFSGTNLDSVVKNFLEERSLGFGQVLPILRLAICGTTNGPSIFEIMELVGRERTTKRLDQAINKFSDYLVTTK